MLYDFIVGPAWASGPFVSQKSACATASYAFCSFRGDPFSRPRWASRMGALSWGLDLANFEGVPVRLHGFEMENVSMMWSAFVAQIMRQVRVRSIP